MLNSRTIKFANISENKVTTNNSEFTVLYHVCLSLSVYLSLISPKNFADVPEWRLHASMVAFLI